MTRLMLNPFIAIKTFAKGILHSPLLMVTYLLFVGGVATHHLIAQTSFYGGVSSLFIALFPMVLMGMWIVGKQSSRDRLHKGLWLIYVGLLTTLAEILGLLTGLIFGRYVYTNVLQPRLSYLDYWNYLPGMFDYVPAVIPLAWIGSLLMSGHVAAYLMKRYRGIFPSFVASVIGSGLMVLFDFFLELFAIRMRYWIWFTDSDMPPLQNYLAWASISMLALFLGNRLSLFTSGQGEEAPYQRRLIGYSLHLYGLYVVYFIVMIVA